MPARRLALPLLLVLALAAGARAQINPQLLHEVAARYLGTPYLWGGTDPARGLDCSAYVRLVMREFGIELPRTSREQYRAAPPVQGNLLPGDLLFFSEDGRRITHVAIYLGNGYMAHSAQSRGGVVIEPARNLQAIYVGANRPWNGPNSPWALPRPGFLVIAGEEGD